MRALMSDVVTPPAKLCVQIVDVRERPCRKEGLAEVVNLALDLPLLIGPVRGAGPRGEVIVPGELEQAGVKANRGAGPFEDGAAKVIVDQGARDAMKRVKGLDVPPQETLERLIQREERTERARIR